MPFLSPGLPLFLQLSHCGTADWATSLCHKALSVRASSQLAESFPSVKTPWVSACSGSLLLSSHSLPDTVTSSVHIYCCLGRTWRCHYVGQGQKSSVHLLMCEVNPRQDCIALFLLCYFVLSGNICAQRRATGGYKVSAFLFLPT